MSSYPKHGSGHLIQIASRLMAGVACLALAGSLAPAKSKSGPDVKDGVLDEIHLKVESMPREVGVIIRHFSSDGADLGTGESKEKKHQPRRDAALMVQKLGPEMAAGRLASDLRESGVFKYVRISDDETPEDAIILDGEFLRIDPGSKAKRYWAGFGAGKSGVQIGGRITDSEGSVLAEWKHMKHSGIGFGGGDYTKFMSDDCRDVASDVAKFLVTWAKGGNLHED